MNDGYDMNEGKKNIQLLQPCEEIYDMNTSVMNEGKGETKCIVSHFSHSQIDISPLSYNVPKCFQICFVAHREKCARYFHY